MSAENVLKQSLKIILGYSNLFGKQCSLDDLVHLLQQYPAEQWLNFLSRIQNTIADERYSEINAQRSVVQGMFSARGCDALTKWCADNPEKANLAFVVSVRQIAVLQELCIVHSPEELTGKGFNEAEDFEVLTDALLIVNDLLYNPIEGDQLDLLAVTAHNQITLHSLPSWRAFPRAIRFYEIGQSTKSAEVVKYATLFANATEKSIESFIFGGILCFMLDDMHTQEEVQSGWYPVRSPQECTNPHEAEVVDAFVSLRSGTLTEIRSEVLLREKDLHPRDFNLIALSRFPIIRLENDQYYILNHTALARSLFEGPRHAIMTNAIPRGPGARKEAGGAYGQIFQGHVLKELKSQFGDRLIVIPEAQFPGQADCIILFKNIVVVAEIKSEHFNAISHYKLMNREERLAEIKSPVLE